MNLKGRNFLKLMDYTPEEILYLIDLAADLKSKKKQGILHDSLIGKNIALIFEKTSTRTRCSFEVAAHDLGMHHHKRHQHKLCRGEHCRKAEHPGVQKLTRALSYFQKIRPQKTDPDRHEHEHPNHIEQALTAHTPELLQARFPVLPPHS